jgi:cell wall-associated NlpC family hydrolase
MSIRVAARRQTESDPIPSLQIMPRLEPAGDGDGASVRTPPSIGLRVGIVALLGAVVVAAAVFVLSHRSHHLTSSPPAKVTAQERQTAAARLALTGARTASAALLSAATAVAGEPRGVTQAAPSPHDLSSSDLTSLADGTSLYQPAGYLVGAYRSAGARYHIPWRVLASLEYIQGGYVNAIAGASAPAERTVSEQVAASGRSVVNARVLAQATAAAAQPSPGLMSDAKQLAADEGASNSPAQGLTTFLQATDAALGADTSAQSVLTLAQSIAPAAPSSSVTPMAKVSAMLDEAHLLNGLPYVWGGGHTEPAWVVSGGYDCSGFVSEVLHSAGYLSSPDTTQTLPGSAGIVKGPGKLVTIYDRTIATLKVWKKKKVMETVKKEVNPSTLGVHITRGRKANSLTSVSIRLPKWIGEWKTVQVTKLVPSLDNTNADEHVIIDIDGQWWESGGSSADGGAAMVHQIVDPSTGYLKSFNQILHPQGL